MQKNLITTLLFSLPAVAVAQTEKPTELQPITVYSAYATPINQDKTASSVTVLTEKDFAERNATYVSDVLKTVPGVAMGANGGRGAVTSLFLRGAESRHTAVIIDGVKVNPVNGGNFDFGGLSLSNIDRIEVLRGEQSALWGSNAMGGVVYITTKSGLYKDKAFNLDYDLGTGSKGTYDGSVTVSGYNNGFYYALNGNSHRTKGISALSKNKFSYQAEDGSAVPPTGGAKERDKFHRDGGSLRLGYDVGDKGVEVLASQSSQTVNIDNGLTDELGQRTRTRGSLLKLGGYWGNDQELFKQTANVSQFKSNANTVGTYPSNSKEKRLNANYQLDVNFDREGNVNQAVSLLADYAKSRYSSNYYKQEKSLSEKSVAMEYRLFTEDDHSLSVSGRYTDNSLFKNALTGRIAGAYRLSPNFRLHASLGKAIKNPTITDLYGWDSSYIGNPDLKAEKSRGGDVGLLIESRDKKHSLDVTYFARVVNDLFSSQGNNCQLVTSEWGSYQQCGSYQAINLNDKSRIKGLELAYNGKFSDNLTAYANYTYTRTKDSQQKELLRRPKHVANAGVHYQITSALGANANVSYVGKRIDTIYPARVKMPSYTLFNLGADYQLNKQFTVYANLNNLFNKKYENVAGYGQYGRNVYVGIKGSF